jgi:hypothetical protein
VGPSGTFRTSRRASPAGLERHAYRLVNRDSFGIYRDGNFDAEDNRYIIGATPDFYGKAKKGDTVDGWFSFTVPKDGSWPLVVYGRTSSGSGGIWFKTG